MAMAVCEPPAALWLLRLAFAALGSDIAIGQALSSGRICSILMIDNRSVNGATSRKQHVARLHTRVRDISLKHSDDNDAAGFIVVFSMTDFDAEKSLWRVATV